MLPEPHNLHLPVKDDIPKPTRQELERWRQLDACLVYTDKGEAFDGRLGRCILWGIAYISKNMGGYALLVCDGVCYGHYVWEGGDVVFLDWMIGQELGCNHAPA